MTEFFVSCFVDEPFNSIPSRLSGIAMVPVAKYQITSGFVFLVNCGKRKI